MFSSPSGSSSLHSMLTTVLVISLIYENYEQNFKQWIPKVSGSKIEMTILMARQAFGAGEPDC